MFKRKPIFIYCLLCLHFTVLHAQTASIIIGSGAYLNGASNAFIVLQGDLRCDGTVNTSFFSTWNFDGSSARQKITCASGSGCTSIYNTNNYPVKLGNVQQNNSNGLAVEINTIVKNIHYFNNGSTQIKEGNYWLRKSSGTPYSLNDSTSKFFVTTGHGLLKQSSVDAAGTFYPVGSASNANDYTPVTIFYSGTEDTFGVRVYDNIYFSYDPSTGDASGLVTNTNFVKKTWIVRKSNRVAGDAFTITPQWNLVNEDISFTPHRPTDICIARNHDIQWFPEASQGPAIPPTGIGPFTYTGVVTYDVAGPEYYPVSVTAINIILANNDVKLSGVNYNNKIALSWSTPSDENTISYCVEKSEDARNYKTIAQVPSFASNNPVTYRFTDESPISNSGILYYRVKQLNTNNQFNYSNTIAFRTNNQNTPILLFPNPVKNNLQVLIFADFGKYTFQLTSANGKLIKTINAEISSGSIVTIRFSNLSKGIYFLHITNQTTKITSTHKVLHH